MFISNVYQIMFMNLGSEFRDCWDRILADRKTPEFETLPIGAAMRKWFRNVLDSSPAGLPGKRGQGLIAKVIMLRHLF